MLPIRPIPALPIAYPIVSSIICSRLVPFMSKSDLAGRAWRISSCGQLDRASAKAYAKAEYPHAFGPPRDFVGKITRDPDELKWHQENQERIIAKVEIKPPLALASILPRELKPGQILSLEELDQEAAFAGAQVTQERRTYRIDFRSPEEIAKAEGFNPNPSKPAGSLAAHVKSDSMGSGTFVSIGLKAANKAVYRNKNIVEPKPIPDFLSAQDRIRYEDFFKKDVSESALQKLNSWTRIGPHEERSADSSARMEAPEPRFQSGSPDAR